MCRLLVFILFFNFIYSQVEQVPEVSNDKNWVSNISYDLSGTTLAKGINYFNDLGKGTQIQSWDVLTNRVWASEVRYDSFGRPVLGTLSAPINNTSTFVYAPNFILSNNLPIGLSQYDSSSTLFNPPVISPDVNTLGWYYSNQNTLDPYQDVTEYPYSRTVFSELNPGAVRAVLGGNKINGEWKQTYSFTMVGEQPVNTDTFYDFYMGKKIMKTVSRDVHGVESVVYTDTDGNLLGAARSGGTVYRYVYLDILDKGYVDIHVTEGSDQVTIDNLPYSTHTWTTDFTGFRFFDLITEQEIFPTQTSFGIGQGEVGKIDISLPPGFYRIEDENKRYTNDNSLTPFRISYNLSYYDLTYNVYDLAGRLKKIFQPLSNTQETTFSYNSLSQLLETTSADEGTSKFKYRKDGQIRFSQNSEQLKEHRLSYTNYDELGRPVESGVYVGDDFDFSLIFDPNTNTYSTSLDAIVDDLDGLPQQDREEQNVSVYDIADTDLINRLQACGIPNTSYVQTFLAGNVSYTYTDNPRTNKTWYSYDAYGRVKWMIQEPTGLDCLKTIDYEYDTSTGQLIMVDYQRYNIAERFVHHYNYNVAGQLTDVHTSLNGTTLMHEAHYIYNESGALSRTELADNLQGIDYVYNLSGQLKAINHPSLQSSNDPGNDGANGFASDVFGMQLDYYNGDYTRNNTPKPIVTTSQGVNQYNGNIKATRWNTQLPSSTQNAYLYEYNRNNWLTQATFGQSDATANITPNINNDYKVSSITYDANGNLMTLNRKGYTDAAGTNNMDNFSYYYDAEKKNRLLYVQDSEDNIDEYRYNDIKNQNQGLPLGQGSVQNKINYIYNDIGQLVTDIQGGISYNYNASGLVTKISGFSSYNSGSLATIYYKNHTIPQTPVLHSGWTIVGSPATNKFSAVIPSVCGLFLPEDPIYEEFTDLVLLQHLGSGTARTNLKVAANTFNTVEFKLLVDKYLYDDSASTGTLGGTQTTGDPIIPTVVVTLKRLDGSIITTQTINDQPAEYCNQYFAETIHLEFVSGVDEEAVVLEISPSHNLTTLPLGQKQQIFFDNLHVQAAVETKVAFDYNDRGHRIRKTSYGQNSITSTNYVRDASGTAMAVYETTVSTIIHTTPVTKIEHGVYGNGRIGVYKRGSGKNKGYTLYELTDHLGNVRAVISKAGTSLVSLTNKTDYYPFGMPMPNKYTTDGNYRYAFQGQEKDGETGMEAFELRLWDGRLGRWLTVDPYGQYHSPYVGMGNNPINLIDPDGGWADGGGDPPSFWQRIGGWFRNTFSSNQSAITGSPNESTAYSINLEEVELTFKQNAKTAIEHFTVFNLAALNSWGSNQVLGAGRLPSDKLSGTNFDNTFRAGQIFGDLAAIGTGGAEFTAGSSMVVGGVVGAPETAGLSLAVSVEGAAVATHGVAVGATATGNLVRGIADFMSKDKHGSSGGDRMGNNRKQNQEVTSLVKKYKLNKEQQRKLHDYITGQGYSRAEIEKIIKTGEYLMK